MYDEIYVDIGNEKQERRSYVKDTYEEN